MGRSFRNQSSNDMALPHPQSRKDHYRNEEKPSWRGVTGNFVKRTVDVAEDRNGKDEVNPANNRTFGGVLHNEYDLLDSRFQLGPSFHGFSPGAPRIVIFEKWDSTAFSLVGFSACWPLRFGAGAGCSAGVFRKKISSVCRFRRPPLDLHIEARKTAHGGGYEKAKILR